MSDEMSTTFSPEQVSQQAQGNVNGFLLVIPSYLKGRGLSMDEFWAFVGRKFAPLWQQGMSAKEAATWAALNMVSGGGKLIDLSGDESHAEAVVGGWPSEESLNSFGVSQEEADLVFGVFQPIAELLGYDYEWRRQGDKITMTFSQ